MLFRSRDITNFWEIVPYIQEGFEYLGIDSAPEIVSGGANGVDKIGECLAEFCAYDLKKFPANWNKHKKAAGPIRNKEMAEYADCAIVIHNGSRGSLNMIEQMNKLEKPVFIKEVYKND